MLTNIVEVPRCQALWQTGCEKEAGEQSTEEVVGVAGAQGLLPTAVGPAPTQLQLVREKSRWRASLGQGTPLRSDGGRGAEGVGTRVLRLESGWRAEDRG